MKQIPILMSGAMVLATLDDSKTQTRRPCRAKTQSAADIIGMAIADDMSGADDGTFEKAAWERIGCPYGRPGDQLWVKETSRLTVFDDVIQYRADMDFRQFKDWPSDDPVLARWIASQGEKPKHWRPSILMPRRASRITLDLLSVRLERLQDISEDDALAEGIIEDDDCIVDAHCHGGVHTEVRGTQYFIPGDDESFDSSVDAYQALWERINGPGSWEVNPWVWVLEFKRVEVEP